MSNKNSYAPLYLAALCLFLPACNKQETPVVQNNVVLVSHLKQHDIPVPVGFVPVAEKNDIALTFYSYKGTLSIDQCTTFYKQAVELDGWEIQDFSSTEEGLLFCNKPNKSCAISVRPMTCPSKQPPYYKTEIRIIFQDIKEISSEETDDPINSKKVNLP